jgi:hypothetical protein
MTNSPTQAVEPGQGSTGADAAETSHGNAPQKEPDTLPDPDAAANGSDEQQQDPAHTVGPGTDD